MSDGKPLPPECCNQIIKRYSTRFLIKSPKTFDLIKCLWYNKHVVLLAGCIGQCLFTLIPIGHHILTEDILNREYMGHRFHTGSIQFASFFPIDPYSAFYALFAANFVSHNSVFLYRPKTQNATVDGMSFRRCLSGGGNIFSKSVERQGGANRTFATGGCCHGWQLEPCPYGLEPLLTFR